MNTIIAEIEKELLRRFRAVQTVQLSQFVRFLTA